MQLVAKLYCTFSTNRDMVIRDIWSRWRRFLTTWVLVACIKHSQDRHTDPCDYSILQLTLVYPVLSCSMSWWICYSTVDLCQMGASCVDNIKVAIMVTWLSFQLKYAVEGDCCLFQVFTSDNPGSQNIGFYFVDAVPYCFHLHVFLRFLCDFFHFIPA